MKWLPKLDKEYCKNVKPKSHNITPETFREVLLNMKNNGAPGNDKTNAFYIKKHQVPTPILFHNSIFLKTISHLRNGLFEEKQSFYQKIMIRNYIRIIVL